VDEPLVDDLTRAMGPVETMLQPEFQSPALIVSETLGPKHPRFYTA
jgi:hypothetical protein